MCFVEQFRKLDVFTSVSSQFNGTYSNSWLVSLSVKCPLSQKVCPIASREPLYHQHNDRQADVVIFLLLHPLLVGSSILAINTPPHTNQCKNLKVAEKLSVIELRLRCSWLWVPSACQGKTDVRKLSELNHHDEIKAKKHLVHAIKKLKMHEYSFYKKIRQDKRKKFAESL